MGYISLRWFVSRMGSRRTYRQVLLGEAKRQANIEVLVPRDLHTKLTLQCPTQAKASGEPRMPGGSRSF